MADPDQRSFARPRLLPVRQHFFHGQGCGQIEGRRRFVEEQQSGRKEQGPDQSDKLTFTAGKMPLILAEEVFVPAQFGEQLQGRFAIKPSFLVRLEGKWQTQVILNGSFDKGRPLVQIDGLPAIFRHLRGQDGLRDPGHLARIDRVEKRQGPQQQRLARPGGADDGHPFACMDLQSDVLEQPAAAVAPAQAASFQERWRFVHGLKASPSVQDYLIDILTDTGETAAPIAQIWLVSGCELCFKRVERAPEDAFMLKNIAALPIHFVRLCVLLLPAALLAGAALREQQPTETNWPLWMGAMFQVGICFLTFLSSRSWRQPLGPSVITLYLIGLGWLWFGAWIDDWYNHLARAILLIVPLIVFGKQSLNESGATRLRRANVLAQRLSRRKDWPTDLHACRTLPEVKAFRAAVGFDAAPALALLSHPRIEVRIAALAALEFRKDWRPGQAEMVLQTAQSAEHPALRAAAISALGYLEDRGLVEMLAEFLPDPSPEVRKAAAEALLWDTERRWHWIRFAIRRLLSDPLYQSDGPLAPDGQVLNQEAVHDLTAWCAEKGVLAARSALTLTSHYAMSLSERPDPKTVQMLQNLLADVQTPSVLRLELGKLLQQFQELDPTMLRKLLDSSNPAPLRLIACETILGIEQDEHVRNGAIMALRELARLPNREIALNTADVVQRRLGVDMGLALGQPLPQLQSRPAADIARRVLHWASQFDMQSEEDLEDSHLVR